MSIISAEVLADSACVATGARVTTFLLKYPRYIHQEVLTHRVFSRNSASSRAIPVPKMLSEVLRNPAVPLRFGAAKKGMQDGGPLPAGKAKLARALWLLARYPAVAFAWLLYKLNVHKQVSNRLLEPWLHMTVVLTGTEFKNFYKLRYHSAAQPEFRALAEKMLRAHAASVPRRLGVGEWHLPFLLTNGEHWTHGAFPVWAESDVSLALKRCTARCARTSYVNFYGKDSADDDCRLHDNLSRSGHWSPFDHCCQATGDGAFCGNMRGYKPYRKFFPQETWDDNAPFDPAALLAEIEKEVAVAT